MNDTSYQQLQASILIVDDNANARFTLKQFLLGEGYQVTEAQDGQAALAVFEELRPDIVLLDALMPNLDGFETCVQLQTLQGGEHTPVLMITSLDDEQSVDHAFEVGAVDYVTKPIHWPVLRQRVRRLLITRQLEKLRDNLTQMIVHDMKTPIALIRGFTELSLEELSPNLDVYNWISLAYRASNNLLDMTRVILDIGRMEEGKLILQPTPRRVIEVLAEVKEAMEYMAIDRSITLTFDCPDEDLTATLDWDLIRRVVVNLVSNAIKHSPRMSTIKLSSSEDPDSRLCISVADEGEGIALEDQVRIFEKFTQATHRKRGSQMDTGLGLTFCKLATEAHGGAIHVQSSVGAGTTFTLLFPLV